MDNEVHVMTRSLRIAADNPCIGRIHWDDSLAKQAMQRSPDILQRHCSWIRPDQRRRYDRTKGTGPAIVALFTGDVQFAFPNLIAVSPHLSAGRLRALAVGSAQRSPLAPDIPTMAEAGVPRFDAGTWYGLIAPRGTPQNAIDTLNRETLSYIQSPDAREKLQALGLVPSTLTTPEEFGKLILGDIEKWRGAIKGAGNLTSE